MKKINIVKKNLEFNNIIKIGKFYKNKYFVVYKINNETTYYKIGISIPKKIGNAVIRNKLKRQIKSIIDLNKKIIKNYKYIIIARISILDIDYKTMEINLIDIFNNINEEK